MYRTFIIITAVLLGFAASAQAAVYEITIHPMGPSRGVEHFSCSDNQICTGPEIGLNNQVMQSQVSVDEASVTIQFLQSGMLVPVSVSNAGGPQDNVLVIPVDSFHGSIPISKRITLQSPTLETPPSYANNPQGARFSGRARPMDIQATVRLVAR